MMAGKAEGNPDNRPGGKEGGKEMACVKCGVALEPIETKFSYLGHEFSHPVPKCPVCGLVYIPEELALGKISEVETMLEDK